MKLFLAIVFAALCLCLFAALPDRPSQVPDDSTVAACGSGSGGQHRARGFLKRIFHRGGRGASGGC
jgi:hypothetical protein